MQWGREDTIPHITIKCDSGTFNTYAVVLKFYFGGVTHDHDDHLCTHVYITYRFIQDFKNYWCSSRSLISNNNIIIVLYYTSWLSLNFQS